MSSDGEINVSVQAEGTADAAGELGGDAGGLPGGGGDGGGGDGGGGRSGRFGQLLKRLATVIAFLGPILNVIGAISKVLEAFVAPVAVLLLRLLQPVLVFFLRLLPPFLGLIDTVGAVIENLNALEKISTLIGVIAGGLAGAKLGAVVGAIIGGFLGSVVPGAGTAIGTAVGAKIGAILFGIIGAITGGATIAGIINEIGGLPEDIASLLPGSGSPTDTTVEAGFGVDEQTAENVNQANINIAGSLAPFIDEVNSDGTIDFP
jgi:hypothetical protein